MVAVVGHGAPAVEALPRENSATLCGKPPLYTSAGDDNDVTTTIR